MKFTKNKVLFFFKEKKCRKKIWIIWYSKKKLFDGEISVSLLVLLLHDTIFFLWWGEYFFLDDDKLIIMTVFFVIIKN